MSGKERTFLKFFIGLLFVPKFSNSVKRAESQLGKYDIEVCRPNFSLDFDIYKQCDFGQVIESLTKMIFPHLSHSDVKLVVCSNPVLF